MAVVLRFVDNLFKIREELPGFVLCQKGLAGEALAKEITDFIQICKSKLFYMATHGRLTWSRI